jgi:hypothetical protein
MQGYQIAIRTGWMTRNEARVLDNMNPSDDPEMDKFLDPTKSAAISPGAAPSSAPPEPSTSQE